MTVEELTVKLTETESRAKANMRRIEKIEKRQDDMDKLMTAVEVLAMRQESVESNVKEIKGDVKRLAEKPARRWEALADKVLLMLAGAFAGWLCAGAPGVS